MFIYNVSLNKTNFVKIVFTIVAICLIIFFCFSAYKILMKTMNNSVNDSLPNSDIITTTNENYTNILKTIHDDLNTYADKKITLTGYVYRVPDFKDNEFVIARDMIINSNLQTLVVGFLCNYNKALEYDNNTWIEITGKIIKGRYYEEIPVIEITNIKKIEKPKDIFVYPPDDNYVPTVNLF